MSRVRQMRGGKDYDPAFGQRMRGTGPLAELLRGRFHVACRRLGLVTGRQQPPDTSLFTAPRRPNASPQLELEL